MTISVGDDGTEVSYVKKAEKESDKAKMDSKTLPKNVKFKIIDDKGNEIRLDNTIKEVSVAFNSLTGNVASVYFSNDSKIDVTDSSYCDFIAYYKEKTRGVRLYFVTGNHSQI